MKRSVGMILCSLSLLAVVFACSGDTEGRHVAFDLAFEGLPDGAAPLGVFDTVTGWHVELVDARIVLGPIYAYAPTTGAVESPLTALLGVPVARAHGGHDPFNGRAVRAESLDSLALDLISPGLSHVSAIDGEAGAIDAITVILEADAEAMGETHGHQAWVEGTATKDGMTVEFVGGLDLPADPIVRRVESVAVAADLDDGGTLVIGVRPSVWLSEAHFDRLDTMAADGRFEVTPTSQVRNSWYLDVRRPDAFGARWVSHNGAM